MSLGGDVAKLARKIERLLKDIPYHAWITRLAHKRAANPVSNVKGPLPPNLIISPGGVGTTFLIQHCEQWITLNDVHDDDGHKHLPRVPGDWFHRARILFISGDPEAIYASIERRNWVRLQSAKLGAISAMYSFGAARKAAFIAKVEQQIAFYETAANEGRALVVPYDAIWDNVPQIADWFGIEDPRFIAEFPSRKPRNSATGGSR